MPLQVFKQAREEDLHELELWHENGVEVEKPDHKVKDQTVKAEYVILLFRRLTAGELNTLSDRFIETNRRGKSRYKLGDNARSKFLKSYEGHRGDIAFEGEIAERITSEIYDKLPAWLSERALSFINRLNGLDEDDEEE